MLGRILFLSFSLLLGTYSEGMLQLLLSLWPLNVLLNTIVYVKSVNVCIRNSKKIKDPKLKCGDFKLTNFLT